MIGRAIYNKIVQGASCPVFEIKAPQAQSAPFVVYRRGIDTPWNHLKGPSGVIETRYHVDVYATTTNEADTIADNIQDTIDAFAGNVYYGTNSPQDFVEIQNIRYEAGFSVLDQTQEPFLYRVSKEYVVTYNRG